MKKILFVFQMPPPIHGASIMNQYIFRSQTIKHHFRVDMLPLNFARSIKDIGELKVRKIVLMFFIVFKLLWKLLLNRPDLLYFTISPTGKSFYRDIILVFIMKLFKVKIVFHLHGKGIKKNSNTKIKKFIYAWVFNNVKVIHLSPLLYFDIKDYVLLTDCYFVPNAIPKIENLMQKKREDKNINVVYLSNMKKSKGVLVLLEAIKQLKNIEQKFTVILAGAWSKELCEEEFDIMLEKYDLSRLVKYIGPVYDEDKVKLLCNSDIIVFPTYYKNESFPIVLLEAMQFSIPIISTYEGAIPEIVNNNEIGFLVKQKNVKELAEKIKILIENKELRVKMGKEGRKKFLKEYSFDKFEQKLISIFTDIINH